MPVSFTVTPGKLPGFRPSTVEEFSAVTVRCDEYNEDLVSKKLHSVDTFYFQCDNIFLFKTIDSTCYPLIQPNVTHPALFCSILHTRTKRRARFVDLSLIAFSKTQCGVCIGSFILKIDWNPVLSVVLSHIQLQIDTLGFSHSCNTKPSA